MPRRNARWLLGTFVATLLVPFVASQSQTVRDSAGVQIVANTRAILAAARAWRIDPKPSATMGASAADADTLNELLLVMGITRLSDGRFAVGVQASGTVRFYDQRGKHVGSAGRRGQGPGEFRQIMGVWATHGDTLVILDNGELEIFTGNGTFVGKGASRSRGGRFVYPEVVLEDGSYLGIQFDDGRGAPPPAGKARRTQPLVRVSRDGTRVDTVGTWLNAEEVFDGREHWGSRVAFSVAAGIEGDDKRFFMSSPLNTEISEFTLAGKQVRSIRFPDRSVKTPDEAIKAYRDWQQAMPGEDGRPMSPASRARMEQTIVRTGFADRLPSFGAMILDKTGNLWVQHFNYRKVFFTPGPARTQTMTVATRWDVLDSAGRWLCTVDLPARFTPVEIGSDYVAGLARDEDELEQVRVYRLLKP